MTNLFYRCGWNPQTFKIKMRILFQERRWKKLSCFVTTFSTAEVCQLFGNFPSNISATFSTYMQIFIDLCRAKPIKFPHVAQDASGQSNIQIFPTLARAKSATCSQPLPENKRNPEENFCHGCLLTFLIWNRWPDLILGLQQCLFSRPEVKIGLFVLKSKTATFASKATIKVLLLSMQKQF